MQRLARIALFLLLPGFVSGFTVPSGTATLEIGSVAADEKNQEVTIFDAKTREQDLALTLDCKSFGAVIRETDQVVLHWNAKRDTFVLQMRRGEEDYAAIVHIEQEPGRYRSHYFRDSHPGMLSKLAVIWLTDTEFEAAYTRANGLPWIERWTIDGGRFTCSPLVVNGKASRRVEKGSEPKAPR